jgi:inorganic pyrophosphatase
MRIDAIAVGKNPPHDINVIIEIPIGGEPIKYEMDKVSGTMFVDRVLQTEMRYPGNYGFVPHTLSDDGDPIDVLVVTHRPIIPGAVINCRPIGVLHMKDESGDDEKILAVPVDTVSPVYKNIKSYRDLADNLVRRIAHFFEHYKDLEEGKWVKVDRWGDEAEARELIVQSIQRAAAAKAKK